MVRFNDIVNGSFFFFSFDENSRGLEEEKTREKIMFDKDIIPSDLFK